jgi:hypothetical protein
MDTINCKNCDENINGNFCSNCGQKTNTVRLNWHFVQEELKYTFLHINKGLLFTIKELYQRPGETIRNFIEGKRVKHYKPVLLVFVLAGVYSVLYHYIDFTKLAHLGAQGKLKKGVSVGPDFMEKITSHYALIELCFIPFLSLWSYLAFKKWGYNYVENIIINCFISGQRIVYSIATFPITYLFYDTKYFINVSWLLGLPIYILTAWTYYSLYKDKDVGEVVLRILLFAFLSFISMIILSIIIVVVVVSLSKNGMLNL